MLVVQGQRGFYRKPTEDRWPGLLVSIGVTLALFVVAFGAMRSVPAWTDRDRTVRPDPAVLIELPRPIIPVPVPRSTPRVKQQPITHRNAPPAVPVGVPPAPASTTPLPAAPTSQPRRDSSTAASASIDASRPASGLSGQATARVGSGAPMSPAGVAPHNEPISPYVRDSIAQAKAKAFAAMAMAHPPTGPELQALQQSQRQAALLQRRTTTAGNSRDLVVLQGAGLNGVGAVTGPSNGVMGSVGLPLFSSGPSAAQRRRNEKLDADYQLRLRRLQDRVLQRQDSVRADSLRRDSLARRPDIRETIDPHVQYL